MERGLRGITLLPHFSWKRQDDSTGAQAASTCEFSRDFCWFNQITRAFGERLPHHQDSTSHYHKTRCKQKPTYALTRIAGEKPSRHKMGDPYTPPVTTIGSYRRYRSWRMETQLSPTSPSQLPFRKNAFPRCPSSPLQTEEVHDAIIGHCSQYNSIHKMVSHQHRTHNVERIRLLCPLWRLPSLWGCLRRLSRSANSNASTGRSALYPRQRCSLSGIDLSIDDSDPARFNANVRQRWQRNIATDPQQRPRLRWRKCESARSVQPGSKCE